jgi:hypothetical protein
MTSSHAPELSVILVTPDRYAGIRNTVRHLRVQNVRDRMELIIVAPAREALEVIESELEGFHNWRVVELGRIESGGQMVAAGIRAATAPVVVYVEEHSFPASGWAEALIKAHRGGWAAVGAAVSNANPDTATSWAALFLEFGAWVPPAGAAERRLLPSHQTSYQRALVLGYGTKLDDLLEAETTLQTVLLAEGHRLYFESAAVTHHVNVSRLSELIAIQYHNYRMFAANRALHGNWSHGRRAVYVFCGPLLPLVRLYRTLREVRRSGRLREWGLRMFLPLVIGTVAAAIGEVVGYTFGAGAAAHNRLTFELERLRHVTDADRLKLLAG